MRILVTGAGGFIGKNLINFALESGHSVISLSRPGTKVVGSEVDIDWALGRLPSSSSLSWVDAAVHLAYDYACVSGKNYNISGTIDLFVMLKDLGVKRQIFVSSYSAGPHAESLYGKTKWEIENKLKKYSSAVIVRPGLVLGEGGIYGRMVSFTRRWPFVPLPEGGKGLIPVIHIERLCFDLLRLCDNMCKLMELNAFYEKKLSLRELVLSSVKKEGRAPWIIPIPFNIMLSLLLLAEALAIKLPVTSDSLVGFKRNQCAYHKSNLEY
jgi:NADH dehydrogenase